MGSEQRQGLAGSLLFHGLLAVVLFFWKINEPAVEPEFIEVSWGTSSVAGIASMAANSPLPAGPVLSAPSPARSLALPERRFQQDQDLLTLPPRTKLDVADLPVGSRPASAESRTLRKELLTNNALGAKENPGKGGRGTTAAENLGKGSGPEARGTSASDIGVAMEWSQGGTRKKLSGALPSYPPGVNVEAQIKIEAVVSPEGAVRSVRPSQKGNARLEEAAMREVHLWTFEPLSPAAPRRDQTCLITFNFRLR
jgi:hypothetical protein